MVDRLMQRNPRKNTRQRLMAGISARQRSFQTRSQKQYHKDQIQTCFQLLKKHPNLPIEDPVRIEGKDRCHGAEVLSMNCL
jgi:hypothetical protein